jgi:hypothetical protein
MMDEGRPAVRLGDVFAVAWRLTYRDYNLFFTIILLSGLFDAVVRLAAPDMGSRIAGHIFSVTGFMISIWGLIALIVAENARLHRRPISLIQAYGKARVSYLPYLMTFVVSTLIILGGILVLILPGLFFAVIFSLAGYAAVIEHKDWRQALTRSKELIQPLFWPVAGLMLVQACIPLAAEVLLAGWRQPEGEPNPTGVILRFLVSSAYMPYLVAIAVVLLHRLRDAKALNP